MSTKKNAGHMGQDIARIREFRKMKQAALAIELGISQQSISKLEKCETIEAAKLKRVATALGVSKEIIGRFSEEAEILLSSRQDDPERVISQLNPSLFCYNCELSILHRSIIDVKDKKIRHLERLIENHFKEEPTLYLIGQGVGRPDSTNRTPQKFLPFFQQLLS